MKVPKDGRVLLRPYDQGVSDLNNGEYDCAIENFGRAIGFDPKYAAAFYMRAIACRAKGDYRRATADFNRAMQHAHGRSAIDLKEALAWNLGNAVAFFNRASAYHNEGNYDRAINNYSEAVRLRPGWAAAFLSRGMAFKERDRNNPRSSAYDERYGGVPDCDHAAEDLEKVLSLDSDPATRRICRAALDELTGQGPRPLLKRP
jgi:tetratricopeptide (TPR) repeat protein